MRHAASPENRELALQPCSAGGSCRRPRRRPATVDDTAQFLAGMPPSAELAVDAADQETRPGSATPSSSTAAFGQLEQRQISQIRDLGRRQSGRAAADDVLHVQRPRLSLRERVLFQGVDLRAERARAGRLGARSDAIAARRHRSALYNVERSLGSILSFSFFITKQMKTDLQRRASSTARCRSFTCSWRARARRSAERRAGRARRQGRGLFRQRKSGPNADARRAHRLRRQRWRRTRRCIISRPTSPIRRRQGERLPEVLRDARSRQQPDQERVLSAALRQFHHRARLSAQQQRHHHPGRFRHSACLLRPEEMAASSRSAAISGRSANSPGAISAYYAELFRRAQPIDFGIGYRWRIV